LREGGIVYKRIKKDSLKLAKKTAAEKKLKRRGSQLPAKRRERQPATRPLAAGRRMSNWPTPEKNTPHP
jgi:uncharacterized protein YdaU (DUF1376 family)